MSGGKNDVLRDNVCGSMVMKTSSTRYTNRVDAFVLMGVKFMLKGG